MSRLDWKGAAARLAAAVPADRLDPAFLRWARGASARGPWALALSGGADSVALALLTWAHFPGRKRSLVGLHFNHRLRGRASAADERFCRALCSGLGIPLAVGRWARPVAGAPEAVSRGARFAFMERTCRVRRVRGLLLGHQQDDVAETLLMRLARGSGAAGLAAPRPVQQMGGAVTRLRPLLGLKKRELASALKASGIPWREDASNRGDAYFRNRVRHRVVAAWARASGRDAVAGAALTRSLLEEDDRALEAWVDASRALGRDRSLSVARLAGVPRAVVRRALHRWVAAQRVEIDLSRQAFEALLAAVERAAPARHSIGAQSFAVIRGGFLRREGAKR
jgi:tRNA(Ile)-lysidine synthase